MCEEKGVSKCYEQGFHARVDSLRFNPAKFILHGVKMPHQFEALHALYEEPNMDNCIGEHKPSYIFSEAQQPPLKSLQGYEFTQHGKEHRETIMTSKSSPPRKIGLDWPSWPVFEPKHCVSAEELVITEWDLHLEKIKKYSHDKPSHVYS